jgi:hypothetical protein
MNSPCDKPNRLVRVSSVLYSWPTCFPAGTSDAPDVVARSCSCSFAFSVSLSRLRRHSHFLVLALTLLLLAVAGCGRSPNRVLVEGRITLGGGDWPAEGTVQFHPVEAAKGVPRIPGSADFKSDGSFRAGTHKPGDGLTPGRYRVTVECWKEWPTESSAGVSHAPPVYRDANKTPLEVLVPDGKSRTKITLDVQRP